MVMWFESPDRDNVFCRNSTGSLKRRSVGPLAVREINSIDLAQPPGMLAWLD